MMFDCYQIKIYTINIYLYLFSAYQVNKIMFLYKFMNPGSRYVAKQLGG
jgi:hypothetical protein